MWVKAIKTPLVEAGDSINHTIARSIPHLTEQTILVIASKIFSYAEGRLVKKKSADKSEKWELAKKESEWWLDPNFSKYKVMLTIKGGWMFANGGIDESNAQSNYYSLWPKDPQASVNAVWRFLKDHYGVNKTGVIMTDSRGLPLNWGVLGHGIAHCGFEALKSYIGKPDLHGRLMQMEQVNMMQSVAVAGTLEMGEGAEQTPIAIVSDVTGLKFQDREPSRQELESLHIAMEDDIYAPLLTGVKWNKGGS